ncbi:collagen-binding domain-containing protein [Sphingomonas sp.]|uniref:collagen-binding domain-containing protein n=1 Tax=Sphingomonas sp. TaxID=28214 RepID=UPI003B3AC93A
MAAAALACALLPTAASSASRLVTNKSAAQGLKYMSQLNVIVFQDMTANHDVEGKTWVGGNLSGSSFTAGIGNATQGAKSGHQYTLTVGGNNTVGVVNLNNGANGKSGNVASNYGMIVGGNSNAFNLNADGATVRIGGNADFDLKLQNSKQSAASGNVSVSGFVRSITATGDGATVHVGSVKGGKIQVGNNAKVAVGSGDVAGDVTAGKGSTVLINGGISNNGKLQVGDGSSVLIRDSVASEVTLGGGSNARIGGSINGNTTLRSGSADQKTVLAVGGSTRGINGSNHNVVTVGGDVNGNASVGTDSQLNVRGRLTSDLSVNGNNKTVVRLGSYGGNSNALNNGATAYVSTNGQNKPGWFFSENNPKPAAPAAIGAGELPTAPAAPNVASQTASMLTSLRDLSTHLQTLSTNSANAVKSTLVTGSTRDWLFDVGSATDGYAVFNVTASDLLDRQGGAAGAVRNIGFNVNGATALPIVINITGLGDATWNWDLGAGSGYGSSLNQQVIWNFADATGTINFKTMVHGSVLALGATVTNTTPIEGSLVAKIFNQGGEVHLGTYNGDVRIAQTIEQGSGAVPEPASWATMLAGFGIIGGSIRRRRWTERLEAQNA